MPEQSTNIIQGIIDKLHTFNIIALADFYDTDGHYRAIVVPYSDVKLKIFDKWSYDWQELAEYLSQYYLQAEQRERKEKQKDTIKSIWAWYHGILTMIQTLTYVAVLLMFIAIMSTLGPTILETLAK